MTFLIILMTFFSINSINAEIIEETRTLSDKTEVYTYLFHKQYHLRDANCHRQVFESRSPRTMIAMGCKLYELEIGPLDNQADKRWFKAMYQCDGGNFPFTAHCFLKK